MNLAVLNTNALDNGIKKFLRYSLIITLLVFAFTFQYKHNLLNQILPFIAYIILFLSFELHFRMTNGKKISLAVNFWHFIINMVLFLFAATIWSNTILKDFISLFFTNLIYAIWYRVWEIRKGN